VWAGRQFARRALGVERAGTPTVGIHLLQRDAIFERQIGHARLQRKTGTEVPVF
jgi:hypothetical protein